MGRDNSICAKPISRLQTLASAVRREQCPSPTNPATLTMRLKEITNQPAKPLTPDQARIENLKKQKEQTSDALKRERDRQKIDKARKQIGDVIRAV